MEGDYVMIFTPVIAFRLDEITTVYYNNKLQPCYVRNDVDYSDCDWIADILEYPQEEIKNILEYETWQAENKIELEQALKLPHWSL